VEIIDYRDFLKNELEAIQKVKCRYSLRAWARDAGISAAFVSQLFSHKKKLSSDKAALIGNSLKWEREKILFFSQLVQYQNCQDPKAKNGLKKGLLKFRRKYPIYYNLEEEQFKLISDWYHFAILEISELKTFKSDPIWIARSLGISVSTCREAVTRLKRLGLLVETNGVLRKTKNNYAIANVASQAIRNFHRQNLDRAKAAIESQPLSEREFRGATMAIDPKNIPLAKKKIAQFTSELMALLEEGEKKVVYHFSSQLFRTQEPS
jgi:uncharacterized protein (TIGR02147 family)